jgi:hypothetical protein
MQYYRKCLRGYRKLKLDFIGCEFRPELSPSKSDKQLSFYNN